MHAKLKSSYLSLLELLPFNTQKFMESRDPGHAPFTLFWYARVGSHQGRSFELHVWLMCGLIIAIHTIWIAIISPHTTSDKCFNMRTENGLCRCQFGVKWGKNRGYPYWIFTPNERVLSFQISDVCAKFHQNWLKIATMRARTLTQIHRHPMNTLSSPLTTFTRRR